MGWKPDQIGDLSGRTAIVTGANSGIGRQEATQLARHGAHVVLAVRDTAAGERAAAGIDGDTHVEHLDLASLESVRAFAERTLGPVDLLVNNAGLMEPPRYRETADGHELQFGTNHLGHFVLTALLLPRLLEAAAARVVTVSSIAHFPRNGGRPEEKSGRVLCARKGIRTVQTGQPALCRRAAAPRRAGRPPADFHRCTPGGRFDGVGGRPGRIRSQPRRTPGAADLDAGSTAGRCRRGTSGAVRRNRCRARVVLRSEGAR